jgi:hypothetical protein
MRLTMRLTTILASILVTLPLTAAANAGDQTKAMQSGRMGKSSAPTNGRMIVNGEKPRTRFLWHVRRDRSLRPLARPVTPRLREVRTPLVRQQRHEIAVVMAKARHSTDPMVVKMLENLLERLQRGDNIGVVHKQAMQLAMLAKLRQQQNDNLRTMGKPRKVVAKGKRALTRELQVLRRLEGRQLKIFPTEKGGGQLRRLGLLVAHMN